MERMKLQTPCCGRVVTSTGLYSHATIVVQRTCPKCQTRYQVILRPLDVDRGKRWVHQADWSPVTESTDKETRNLVRKFLGQS